MPEAFPKLREDIDAAPANRDGEPYFILYDRAGVASARLLVSPPALLAASCLDGRSSILDVADRVAAKVGGGMDISGVSEVVDALAAAHFLDDPTFHDFKAQADRDFMLSPVRPAASAGSAYSDKADELAADLDRMLREAPEPEERPGTFARGHPAGMIVPHIDFARGAPGYGQAYRLLKSARPPRTVVVVGTAHLPTSERLSLCAKSFDTPLGTVECDAELADRLRAATAPHGDIDADVIAHRAEHSVELQAVWLRRVFGEKTKILPILAGSLGEFIEGGGEPARAGNDPLLVAAAACLREAVEKDGAMVLASADLAHVGPRFGDRREITNKLLAEVEASDRDYLAAAASGDAVKALANLAAHNDRHHVCGSACIFLLGMALPGRKGRLLGYHQAATPEMRQAVTYAAMAFA